MLRGTVWKPVLFLSRNFKQTKHIYAKMFLLALLRDRAIGISAVSGSTERPRPECSDEDEDARQRARGHRRRKSHGPARDSRSGREERWLYRAARIQRPLAPLRAHVL